MTSTGKDHDWSPDGFCETCGHCCEECDCPQDGEYDEPEGYPYPIPRY